MGDSGPDNYGYGDEFAGNYNKAKVGMKPKAIPQLPQYDIPKSGGQARGQQKPGYGK